MTLLQDRSIGPIQPVTKLPISEAETGLCRLQGSNNIGKVVLTLRSEERVLAEVLSPLRVQGRTLLRADATYLVTGSTGGVGRSLVPWMLSNRASNVILLGRSSASNPNMARLI
jgi:FlaA1/EpsC-like NDP-sugar epimerase